MLQTIINALVPVLLTAITGVLVAVIKAVGDAGVKLIAEKISATKVKAGADQYNHYLTLAKQAWNIVDEEFRITPNLEKTIAAKQAEFETQIKKLIPSITDDEIEQLRQAVAGEVNKGKAAVAAEASSADGDLTAGTASATTVAATTTQA
jgi:hypothetical protein